MFTECDVKRLISDLESFKRQVQETYAITNDVEEVIILHNVIKAIDHLTTTVTPLLRQPPLNDHSEDSKALQSPSETTLLVSKAPTFH